MAEDNMTVERLQSPTLPINEPSRPAVFEKQGVVSVEDCFESVYRGESCPIIPGLTSDDPGFFDMSEDEVSKQRKRAEEMPNTIIKIADRFKKALISSGTMLEDANIAFNRVIDGGFQAIRERSPRKASRALTEPIQVIVEVKNNTQLH